MQISAPLAQAVDASDHFLEATGKKRACHLDAPKFG
jgi:hypothetical protein